MNLSKNKQQGKLALWIAIIFIIGFWVWFFKFAPTAHYLSILKNYWDKATHQVKAEKISSLEASSEDSIDGECASKSPKHGQAVLLSDTNIKSKLHSRFYIVNEHIYPLLITFVDQEMDEDLGAVYIKPNQSKQMNIPVGDYQLYVESGTDWCNFEDGFLDGVEIYSDKTVQIKADNVVNLRAMAYGKTPSDAMLSFSNSLGYIENKNQRIQGSGSLVLQRVVGGHYMVSGTVNGLPANFLVDTGATTIAISERFARQAGITGCMRQKVITANGIVSSCRAIAKELTLGQFTLKNVQVTYHKGIGNDFLLGMNVIGLFRMEQQGDVMKLTR